MYIKLPEKASCTGNGAKKPGFDSISLLVHQSSIHSCTAFFKNSFMFPLNEKQHSLFLNYYRYEQHCFIFIM